jgi:hypothetical protein
VLEGELISYLGDGEGIERLTAPAGAVVCMPRR